MKLVCWFAVLVASVSSLFAGQANSDSTWPALPTKGFISGRPATQKDVEEGRAVFVLAQNGVVIGKPINITIPQYALLDNKTSSPIRVVVVQAEEFPKGKLVGVRDASGKEYVAKLEDLKLLGNTVPK